MQIIDRKIILKSYEYFLQNTQLFICQKSLQHDLRLDEKTFNKALERLKILGFIEYNDRASSGIPYQLSDKGIQFAQSNIKTFFEKIAANTVVRWSVRLLGFVLAYILGLYTGEIKSLINYIFVES